MQDDLLFRIALTLSRIRETNPICDHALRLRLALKVRKAVDLFIAEEVRAANSKPQEDESYLSWAQIGSALELSKTAAYARYGGREKNSN